MADGIGLHGRNLHAGWTCVSDVSHTGTGVLPSLLVTCLVSMPSICMAWLPAVCFHGFVVWFCFCKSAGDRLNDAIAAASRSSGAGRARKPAHRHRPPTCESTPLWKSCRRDMGAVGPASFARLLPVLGLPLTEPRAVSIHKLRTRTYVQSYASRALPREDGEWNLNLAKRYSVGPRMNVRSWSDRRQLSRDLAYISACLTQGFQMGF